MAPLYSHLNSRGEERPRAKKAGWFIEATHPMWKQAEVIDPRRRRADLAQKAQQCLAYFGVEMPKRRELSFGQRVSVGVVRVFAPVWFAVMSIV